MPHITEYMSTDEVAVILGCEKWEVGVLLGRHLHCRFEAKKKLSHGRGTYHLNNHENIVYGEFVWDYLYCDVCTQHREVVRRMRREQKEQQNNVESR